MVTETPVPETIRSRAAAAAIAKWQPAPGPRIPIERFGRDHWSTFAYVETRTVDHDGYLDRDHMRCSASIHPMLAAAGRHARLWGPPSGGDSPTRIKGPGKDPGGQWPTEDVLDHDDYSCLDDCMAAGLLIVEMPHPDPHANAYRKANGRFLTSRDIGGGDVPRPSLLSGTGEQILMAAARWVMTPLGVAVASQLRAWKASGGDFHGFEPDMDEARRAAGES